MEKLTESQKDALERMPDNKWFFEDDVFHISRPRYNLQILYEKGYLIRSKLHLNKNYDYPENITRGFYKYRKKVNKV